MTDIHPSSVVADDAKLAPDVKIGPFCRIGPGVEIGGGTELISHVVIEGSTRIGEGNRLHPFTSIGTAPQDHSYKGETTYLEIGDNNIIRENVTINRGAHDEKTTRVGSNCLLMIGVHIAHDCQLGSHLTLANLVTMGGHVRIEDRVVIGGLTVMHQWVRVGTLAMVGGASALTQDAPPYMTTFGPAPAKVYGLNKVGLKRNGVSDETQRELKKAYRLLYRAGKNFADALDTFAGELSERVEIEHLADFFRNSKRGVCRGASQAERN